MSIGHDFSIQLRFTARSLWPIMADGRSTEAAVARTAEKCVVNDEFVLQFPSTIDGRMNLDFRLCTIPTVKRCEKYVVPYLS